MTDRSSDHLNEDVSAEGAVPDDDRGGAAGTPVVDPRGMGVLPSSLVPDEDDTANPV